MFTSQSAIGICGAGAMGAGIAQVAAQAGHCVVVLDQNDLALARGRDMVANGAAALLKRGKIDEREAQAIAARIRWTTSIADLAKSGLVIEAIVEDPDVKRALFADLERVTSESAVIATNTSSLSVTALAGALARPERFLGLHFFNPAPVMKLVEVVSGAATDKKIARAALALMEAWGKTAVHAKDVPGFIVNRVARPYYSEGWRALEEGAASAATIDFLFRDLAGFRMGPLELGDFIGHDINYKAATSVYDAYFGRVRFAPSLAQGQLVAAGRLGRKSGSGVFDYAQGAETPAPDYAAPASGAVAGSPSPEALISRKEQAVVVGVSIAMTDGRPAGLVAQAEERPAAVLDYARDPSSPTALAYAASDQAADEAARAVIAGFGKQAVRVADRPGLVVFRTLAQLANCAADAVRDQVADADSIDRAMVGGVNYPFGPLAWAREFGVARVVTALENIAGETGEAMYLPSETLGALARRQP